MKVISSVPQVYTDDSTYGQIVFPVTSIWSFLQKRIGVCH